MTRKPGISRLTPWLTHDEQWNSPPTPRLPSYPSPLPHKPTDQMPRKGQTLSLSEFHNPPLAVLPTPGEIWWATCSVRQVILDAILKLCLGPPSEAMVSDITSFTFNGGEKKDRPCIILQAYPVSQTVSVIPLATFRGRAITSLDRYIKDLCVSIDRTPAWPLTSSYVLHPSPSWPLSWIRPCYAVSHAITIKYSALLRRYAWPVQGPRGTADAEAVAAAMLARRRFTWLRRPMHNSIAVFLVNVEERKKLQAEIDARENALSSKPVEEVLAMNATYDASRGVPL